MTIDWGGGYTSRFKLYRVSEDTWADTYEVPDVDSISINRDGTDDYPLLETASLVINGEADSEMIDPGYYRIALLASDGFSGEERYDLATVLLESGYGTVEKGSFRMEVDGYSVLQPAKDRKVVAGTYAPKGCDGAAYAVKLLRECVACPVEAAGSFALDDYVVFDSGSTYIQCVWTLLDAAGWCMRISGNGMVTIQPKPDESSLYLDSTRGMRILQPEMDRRVDLSGVPNVYYAVSGDYVEVVVNDDPDSSTSTVNRGRMIDEIDENPIRVNGETLWQYARRMLIERSVIVKRYTYTREYQPDVFPFDLVRANIPSIGFTGDLRVLTQTLTCGHGVQVSETLGLEIQEFTG